MNANVPRTEAFVRREFLYDLDPCETGFAPCTVFAVCGLMGFAPTFHAIVHETGALFGRLPIHAFAWREDAPARALDDVCLWDSFSFNPCVIQYEPLGRCMASLKGGDKAEGSYLFTVDWCQSDLAHSAGDGGWKCHHVLKLDEGNFAALPNNRILWALPEHITEPYSIVPDYAVQSTVWHAEQTRRWGTTEGFAYGVKA